MRTTYLVFLIIGLAAILLLPPPESVGANDLVTVQQTTTITVINETDLAMQCRLSFYNPHSEGKNVNFSLEVPWIFRGGEVLFPDKSNWIPIPKNITHMGVETTVSELSTVDIIFRIQKKESVKIEDGKHSFGCKFGLPHCSLHKVEIRIPKDEGLKDLHILSYSDVPDYQFDTSEHRVLNWEWKSSREAGGLGGDIDINYEYNIPWRTHLFTIFGWLGAGIIGVLIDRAYQRIQNKKKES